MTEYYEEPELQIVEIEDIEDIQDQLDREYIIVTDILAELEHAIEISERLIIDPGPETLN